MIDDLLKLIEAARTIEPSPEQRDKHRRSFVFGNTAIENELITREMVDDEADALARERNDKPAAS